MSEQWYVRFPEKISGPFSIEQLQKLAGTGKITSSHQVSPGREQWVTALSLGCLTFGSAMHAPEPASAAVVLTCECGHTWMVPATFAGTKHKCPQCAHKVDVILPPRAIELTCACGHSWTVSESLSGTTQKCPECAQKVYVPLGEPAPSPYESSRSREQKEKEKKAISPGRSLWIGIGALAFGVRLLVNWNSLTQEGNPIGVLVAIVLIGLSFAGGLYFLAKGLEWFD